MSGKSIISNAYLEDIGNAIRQKKGTEDTYYPSQMGSAIRSIENITVDDSLSDTSENPVQNKVITQALQSKCDTETVSALSDTVTALDNDVTALQTTKADKSYVDTQLATKASTQTVSDLADDVSDLQTGLAGKVGDVQVNGSSIVSDGVASILKATGTRYGVVRFNGDYGIAGIEEWPTPRISKANSSEMKGGTQSYAPIVPFNQHESAFYGLAKVAGHDEKLSTLPVGTYSEEAKIAIQKMLGIYEAPWELIREDTFTNEEEADHIITADANGDAFELTDLVFAFWLPKQSTYAKKGSYGQVRFMKNGAAVVTTESSAWEQQANANPKGFMVSMEDHNGMVFVRQHVNALFGYTASMTMRIPRNFDMTSSQTSIKFAGSDFYVDSINIVAVTGTGHYRLYGKRRWN